MAHKVVQTSLNEDLAVLGITGFRGTGVEPELSPEEPVEASVAGADEVAEGVDPLDSPDVNDVLFDRIMGLPFDAMTSEDIDEVLEALKEKNLPEDEDLAHRAEQVVDFLIGEGRAKRVRKARAGKVSKKVMLQCPPGQRQDPKRPGRCVRAAKVAGGAGKLARQRRMKKKWSKTGGGKRSARKSLRLAGIRGESVSPFALELASLVEGTEEQMGVRDEIMERVGRIFDMLSEEFNDASVFEVFNEAYTQVDELWSNGRLDEEVMDESEFISTVKPLVTLIAKSLDRIDRQERGDLGNV